MTVTGGASGENTTVPPTTPGPVPSLPAMIVNPRARPRLCEGMVVPRVSVMAPLISTSWPAHSSILPSVAVSVWKIRTSRPALSEMLPLVVVIAPLTLTSRPQQTTRLPLVAVIALLMLTSPKALSVSVVGVPEAVQAIASLTMILPSPPLMSPAGGIVLITTLLVTSCAESVAPEILPPAPMMKSAGSISQVPNAPSVAAVVTLTLSAIRTLAAEVSIKPPSPPLGALASSTPSIFIVPLSMSPSNRMVPLRFSSVRASMMPVLLTAVRSRLPAACAVISTLPPSALSRPPFWTSAPTAPLSIATLSSPSPATSSVIASPAASATVPRFARIVPLFSTCAPSSAT